MTGKLNNVVTKSALALSLSLALIGCDRNNTEVLEGAREPIRAGEISVGVQPAEVLASKDLRLPRARSISSWTHSGAGADHMPEHAELAESVSLVWSADIGSGNDRRHRITSQPVADNGRVFTLDSAATVSALDESGALLWQTDLAPRKEAEDASGGGLATDGTSLFVTSSFGTLSALDVATGAVEWTQELDATGATAPTVVGGIVYLVSGDNRAWAIDAGTGRISWTVTGVEAAQGVSGGGSPAVGRSLAIFPFSSGDVQAVFRRGGFNRWTASISGGRDGFAISAVTDITTDPVIDNGRVYVGNHAGRITALDAGTGERIWTARQGAVGAIVPVGRNDLFVLSDRNQIMRLSARTGETIWSRQLPMFTNDNPKKRDEIVAHYGPLLAGGRLIVGSSDGKLRSYSVTDGALLGEVKMPAGASSNPIVVNETLYILSDKGTLLAFR